MVHLVTGRDLLSAHRIPDTDWNASGDFSALGAGGGPPNSSRALAKRYDEACADNERTGGSAKMGVLRCRRSGGYVYAHCTGFSSTPRTAVPGRA